MDKFYDLYIQNKVSIEDLDDFLEEWHKSDSNEEINEYLGLTEKQYEMWCDDPNKLKKELDKKHKIAYYDKDIKTINCIDGILIIKKDNVYKKIQLYNNKIYDITLKPKQYNNDYLKYEYCIYNHNYDKYRQVSFEQAKDYLVRKCDVSLTLFNSIFYEIYDQEKDKDIIFVYKGFTVLIEENSMKQEQMKSLIDKVEKILPKDIYDKIRCHIQIIKGQGGGLKYEDGITIRLGNNSIDKLNTLMHEFGHLYARYIKKEKVDELIDFIAYGEDDIKLKTGDVIEIDYGLLSDKMQDIKVKLKVLQVKQHKFKARFIPEEQGDEDSWYGDEYYDLITKINDKDIKRRSISQYSKYDRGEFIAQYFAGYFLNKIKDEEIKNKVKEWF